MAVTSFAYLDSNVYKDVDANATGELLVAGTPTIFSIKVDNTANEVACYLKIYAKATAPTVGTDVPSFIFKVPASDSFEHTFNMGLGHTFADGLGIGCVTESGVAGVSSPTNPVLVTALTD